ncbi:MAG: DUF1622 domain-containing protein [Fibrobacter sp.]|nr:DUF1622 domain-containing protein [Fibrobacter sp.]
MELSGVATIVIAALLSPIIALVRFNRNVNRNNIYIDFRRSLGKGILLGLEFLIAADILRTVAIQPTLRSVAILASIVVIRTFLSFTLEVEMNGKWPWQSDEKKIDQQL